MGSCTKSGGTAKDGFMYKERRDSEGWVHVQRAEGQRGMGSCTKVVSKEENPNIRKASSANTPVRKSGVSEIKKRHRSRQQRSTISFSVDTFPFIEILHFSCSTLELRRRH